jgi:hypothetical protein
MAKKIIVPDRSNRSEGLESAAHERATGNTISLDAPHPLLQSHLMKDPFPSLDPVWEDDLTRELKAFHNQMFAKQSGRRHAIEARYL